MTENKRFSVKQRQCATNYSIIDYYGELPLSEGIYYKSNANKLCKWLNTQHELLNTLYKENEKLKQQRKELLRLIENNIEIYENINTNVEFHKGEIQGKLTLLYNLRELILK